MLISVIRKSVLVSGWGEEHGRRVAEAEERRKAEAEESGAVIRKGGLGGGKGRKEQPDNTMVPHISLQFFGARIDRTILDPCSKQEPVKPY